MVPGGVDELDVGAYAFGLHAVAVDLDGDPTAGERDAVDPEAADRGRQDRVDPHLAVGDPGVEAQNAAQE